MGRDIVNFNAGPAGLPDAALKRAHEELLDFAGTGMSIMEHSHRGKAYDAVHREAMALVKQLLAVPDTHDVLFLQGGASGMFATIPLNFLGPDQTADYVITGTWSEKALAEAKIVGKTHVAATGAVDGKFTSIPTELDLTDGAAYVHITSNNTIAGTQFQTFPTTAAPLIADMSSDIMARPLDVSSFAMIYAGAQKNLGPSGVTLVIAEKALIERGSTTIPKILRYKTHADKESLYHTPPTFAIYLMRNVLAWIDDLGGLDKMAARNEEKAATLYGAIDASDGYYRSPVDVATRSRMNAVWRLPSEELEAKFIAEATESGLVGLKGHRSVGGLRASTYNAVSPEGVGRLVDFMKKFAASNPA
ncbi:MAG: 3-phosphoserine/phosphohydroxythreonine transaminase [Deltaproteobacteria bacterium]